MNIITANIFLISDGNEYETFNFMHYLLNSLELREFFVNGFPKLLMFIFIFKEFIKEKFPEIQIKLSNNLPICIKYNIGNLGRLCLLLSPINNFNYD